MSAMKDAKSPYKAALAGVLEARTVELWRNSEQVDSFLGITVLDSGVMFARPCFYKVGERYFSYETEPKELDIKAIEGRYEKDFIEIEIKGVEGALTKEIVRLNELLEKADFAPGEFDEYQKQLSACQDVLTKYRGQADEKAQAVFIAGCMQDTNIRRILVDQAGHSELIAKIRKSHRQATRSAVPGAKGELVPRNIVGWSLKGNKVTLAGDSAIFACVSALNRFLHPKLEPQDPQGRFLPVDLAQASLNAINLDLGLEEKMIVMENRGGDSYRHLTQQREIGIMERERAQALAALSPQPGAFGLDRLSLDEVKEAALRADSIAPPPAPIPAPAALAVSPKPPQRHLHGDETDRELRGPKQG